MACRTGPRVYVYVGLIIIKMFSALSRASQGDSRGILGTQYKLGYTN